MASQASSFSIESSSPAPSSSISHQDDTESQTSQRKRRKTRATSTWEHFRDPKPKEKAINNHNQRLHYCTRCIQRPWSTASTTNAIQHLRKEHNITSSHLEPKNQDARLESIEIAFRRQGNLVQHTNIVDQGAFHEAIIQLIAICNLPLSFIERPEFQAVLLICNPNIEELIIESRSTIPRLLVDSFVFYRENLQEKLACSQSLIHVSTDLWTSPNRRAYLAIVAHWLHKWKRQKALLALPRLYGSHGGELQAVHVLQTLEDYNICGQLGYHTSDNASSNDNLLRHLAICLREKYGIEYDAATRRIRCSGHIINLSLQAFLFASNQEAVKAVNKLAEIEEEVDVAAAIESAMQQGQRKRGKAADKAGCDKAAGWRSIGPLGAHIYTFSRVSSAFAGFPWRLLTVLRQTTQYCCLYPIF
jgi:hypothetical protein